MPRKKVAAAKAGMVVVPAYDAALLKMAGVQVEGKEEPGSVWKIPAEWEELMRLLRFRAQLGHELTKEVTRLCVLDGVLRERVIDTLRKIPVPDAMIRSEFVQVFGIHPPKDPAELPEPKRPRRRFVRRKTRSAVSRE